VEEEGTFLVHVRGLTTKGGGDDEVANILIIKSDDEVRGYCSYLVI
jgi:hypothetical protein